MPVTLRHVPLLAAGVLIVCALLLTGSAVEATPIATRECPDDPINQPDWDDEYISACNTSCQINYLDGGDMDGYNECYACTCLVGGAETVGEMISALSQCNAEQ